MERERAMSKPYELTAIYPVVGVEDPAETAAALQRWFGLQPVFQLDWYVHLVGGEGRLQIGVCRYDHDSVPKAVRKPVVGAFVTIDASDVAAVWEAIGGELDVVHPLTDESWGGRHFICRLPGGVYVDVTQMLPAAA
jgi:hypothetical protein